jgi:hypothetical protein
MSCDCCCRVSLTREAIDLTAGGGLGQLAQQLSHNTEFLGYDDASLQLDGCQVVGLLVQGQPVQEVDAAGGGRGRPGWISEADLSCFTNPVVAPSHPVLSSYRRWCAASSNMDRGPEPSACRSPGLNPAVTALVYKPCSVSVPAAVTIV